MIYAMNIIVTGAAGFIGAAMAERLCREGHEVLGIDNFTTYYDPQLKHARVKWVQQHKNFHFKELDLCNREKWQSSYREFRPQVVVHLAAQAGVRYSLENPSSYIDSNITGFLNVLETVRHLGADHLIYASSSSVYGANSKMPFSEHQSTEHPVSLYAATKKANEMMAHSYSTLFKIPTTGLRFFTVYGPWGRPDMAVFSFTKKILAGETIEVFNHGRHHRDFTYVDDIVESMVRLIPQAPQANKEWQADRPDPATANAPYRIFNIGNSSSILLADFIADLEKVTGKKAKTVPRPMQPGDVPDTYADVSDLEKVVDFKPKTSLYDGLSRFYSWYKEYYRL